MKKGTVLLVPCSSASAKTRRRSDSLRIVLAAGLAISTGWASNAAAATFIGGVYAGTNSATGNSLAAYGRNSDGTLSPIGNYATGGLGGSFDDGNGLDPLISEDSVLSVDDRFVLAVNAGSNSISSFLVNADYSLTLVNTVSTGGVGPNSIAYRDGLVYVTNVDSDGRFTSPADQSGNVTGLRFDRASGQLSAIAGSSRELGSRPANVEFSTDGNHLVVSSVNGGSSMLESGSTAQLSSYGVLAGGNLTPAALASTASTLPGNTAGRNLPTSIGFEIVERNGVQIVIATEAREFLPNGDPGMLPMFQTGSVSTWRLNPDGSLTALSQDVLTGPTAIDGPTSACWIVVSPTGDTFWVASASGATISSFRLNSNGTVTLLDGTAAMGIPSPLPGADGFIDLTASGDGANIYQLLGLKGTINVYGVRSDGSSLALIQQATGLLPRTNSQGIALVGAAAVAPVPEPATWAMMIIGFGMVGSAIRRRRSRPYGERAPAAS